MCALFGVLDLCAVMRSCYVCSEKCALLSVYAICQSAGIGLNIHCCFSTQHFRVSCRDRLAFPKQHFVLKDSHVVKSKIEPK